MSGVTPSSTSAELAKDTSLEESGSSHLPGAFPETPAFEKQEETFSVNPIPATEGTGNPVHIAPGQAVPHPSTLTTNTVASTVHDDADLQEPATLAAPKDNDEAIKNAFSVAPIPASSGFGNPMKLAAGEPVPDPSTISGNTIGSTVRTDQKSYETGAYMLPPVVTPQVERDEQGRGVLDIPGVSKNMIPESSLPMGESVPGQFDASPTVHSSGPASTTAQLAAQVPKEPRDTATVPEIVKESQDQAGFQPEASAIPAEVKDKNAVEKELLSEVPKAPATSEGIAGQQATVTPGETVAAVGSAALAVGGAFAAYAATAKDKVVEAASSAAASLPDAQTTRDALAGTASSAAASLPDAQTIKSNTIGALPTVQTTGTDIGPAPVSSHVPVIVQESQAEAGVESEASAIPEEVREKSAVEKELLAEVPKVPTTAEGTGGEGTKKSEASVSAGDALTAVGGAATALGGAAVAAAYTAKDNILGATESAKTTSTSTNGTSATEGIASYLPEAVRNAPTSVAGATSYLPESIQQSISSINSQYGAQGSSGVAETTPAVVEDSIAQSGESPEAAAYEEPVADKAAMEKELLGEVVPTHATGESAPTIGGRTSIPERSTPARDVPSVVKESLAEVRQSPEAAAYKEPVAEKSAVEEELLSEVHRTNAAGESAPAIVSGSSRIGTSGSRNVVSGAAPGSNTKEQTAPVVTSGVSSAPTERLSSAPAQQYSSAPAEKSSSTPTRKSSVPVVTSGVTSAPTQEYSTPAPVTPAKPATPVKPTTHATPLKDNAAPATPPKSMAQAAATTATTKAPASSSKTPVTGSPAGVAAGSSAAQDKADKKKKRTSIFGKLKAKFSDKDKA